MDKILVVEDDLLLREGLVFNLTQHGYEVSWAEDGPTALEKARASLPDLVLLDVMLPGLDGYQVCRILRQEMSCPILMVTAKGEEIDRVIGLEIGADDYITKPFSTRELLARIKAHLRHERMVQERLAESIPETASRNILTSGDIQVDLDSRQVSLAGKPLALKPREYDLLVFFLRHPKQALSRARLLEEVWGWKYFGDTHNVDVHVHWLRELIESDPQKPVRIVTVRGSGYRFEG